jgi:hypothetical protein
MLVGPISPLLHFWILPAQKNTKNVARPKNKKNKFVWGSRRVSLHTCPYTQRNTKGEKKREREREKKKRERERRKFKKKQREREGESHIGGKKKSNLQLATLKAMRTPSNATLF